MCGGRSGAIWLPLHHPGGCCTLVVDEEIPPHNVERLEKCYIKCNELLLLKTYNIFINSTFLFTGTEIIGLKDECSELSSTPAVH